MKRGGKTAATLLTAAAFIASSPEVNAQTEPTGSPKISETDKRKPASRLARGLLKQIGGRILNMKPHGNGVTMESAIDSLGTAARSVTIDAGSSLEPDSNGKYTMEASTHDIGRNDRFDRSDVDRVEISSGSYTDDGPLFTSRLYHIGKRWMDDPLFINSYYVRGTAINEAGSRDRLLGSTNPLFRGGKLGEKLNRAEVAATGSVMNGIINEALSGQPTHRIEPPFEPVQNPGHRLR